MAVKSAVAAGVLLLGLGAVLASEGRAESRRALLVGIDTYNPRPGAHAPAGVFGGAAGKPSASPKAARLSQGTWTDLDGAVNDARAMREVLVRRFGFPPDNVLVIENEAATRERILDAFRTHLIEPAQPGDRLVFFYAGHGSRIRNSRSDEPDGRDETLVPADFGAGVVDIRDKEVARLSTQALNRGAVFTAIFDSCHSGSMSRGPTPVVEKSRVGPMDDRDVAELVGPEPPPFTAAEGPPETRPGALFLFAAQEDESALEAIDEQKVRHGAFTLALLRTLAMLPPQAPAKLVFSRVSALLKADRKLQQPVLQGTEARQAQALFGGAAAAGGDRLVVNVIKTLDERRVELQGGWAVGLTAGSELKKIGAPADGSVRVRVVRVIDVGRSEAERLDGAVGSVRPGDAFELEKWGVESPGLLRLWMAPPYEDLAGLTRVARDFDRLRASPHVTWVEDPWKRSPTHVLFWSGGEWTLSMPDGTRKGLGRAPSPDQVLAALGPAGGKKAELFVNLPPWRALAAALDPGGDPLAGAVQRADRPEDADYLLVGRLRDGAVEYAWSLKNVTESEAPRHFPMPIRTDWVSPDRAAGDPTSGLSAGLKRQTARLSRLQGWLTLKGNAEGERFPYSLALLHAGTGRVVGQEDLLDREIYGLVLRAEPDRLREVMRAWGVERRFVYVFVIDTHGKSTLLFPPKGGGNVGNHLPLDVKAPAAEIPLGGRELLQIGEPFGTDTYILLATKEALPDPDILDAEGVLTRGGTRGGPDNELSRLIEGIGVATRGGKPLAAPSAWAIQRVTLRSVPRGQ